MNPSARILVVSRDEMLLQTRELILGAFFEVEGAGRASEARLLIEKLPFNLVVLCHSIAESECIELSVLARRHSPDCLILATSANASRKPRFVCDQYLGVDEGPYALLKKCAEMLGFALKSKSKAAHSEPVPVVQSPAVNQG